MPTLALGGVFIFRGHAQVLWVYVIESLHLFFPIVTCRWFSCWDGSLPSLS